MTSRRSQPLSLRFGPDMPSRLLALAVAGLCLLPGAASAQVAGYRLDPVHTRVMFTLSHAGYSRAIGTVSGSEGLVVFDPDDWSTARLSVEVPLRELDMGDDKWTQAVLGSRFLDVARHPVARFESDRVEPVEPVERTDPGHAATGHAATGRADPASRQPDHSDQTHARVCGTLWLHGVERPLCLDVRFNQLKRYPLPPFRTTAGFSATATLKRSDFGITAWKSLVGDEVELRIEAEAVRKGDVLEAIDANRPPAESSVDLPRDDDAPVPPEDRIPAP